MPNLKNKRVLGILWKELSSDSPPQKVYSRTEKGSQKAKRQSKFLYKGRSKSRPLDLKEEAAEGGYEGGLQNHE